MCASLTLRFEFDIFLWNVVKTIRFEPKTIWWQFGSINRTKNYPSGKRVWSYFWCVSKVLKNQKPLANFGKIIEIVIKSTITPQWFNQRQKCETLVQKLVALLVQKLIVSTRFLPKNARLKILVMQFKNWTKKEKRLHLTKNITSIFFSIG